MIDRSEHLESAALRLLLDGDDPVLNGLRQQLACVVATRRERTGAGSYTYFTLSEDAPRLPGEPSFAFGDVIAEVEGLDIGCGFVLFVREGRFHMLEMFSYDDSCPMVITDFRIKYQNEGGRDLAALRHTVGWPTS